jgi:hypothetical protein
MRSLPLEWAFWERFDRAFLETCSEVRVLTLDGWRESRGVQAEMALARELGKPVILVEPDALNDRTPACAGAVGTPACAEASAGREGLKRAMP